MHGLPALLLSLILLFLCVLVVKGDVPYEPRTWIVNLDLPPEQRWPWEAMMPYYNQSVHEGVALIGQFIPPDMQTIVEDLAAQLLPFLGDYAGEISSLAKLMNIDIGKAVLLNLIYEAEAGCTSIITNDEQGNILHGRNLDFNLAPVLRNLTINVHFYKSGQLLYYGTTYVAYVGLLTGMRPGAFSVSADERNTGYLFENVLEGLFIPGTTAACFLIRDTLEQITTYEDAVDHLSSVSLAAPIYLIVGGVKADQGAVITRDRMYAEDIWRLEKLEGRWFEVETNYDHWEIAQDQRRQTANTGMHQIGFANMTLGGLMKVLSLDPVCNDGTTYTALMSAALGNYTSYVRNN